MSDARRRWWILFTISVLLTCLGVSMIWFRTLVDATKANRRVLGMLPAGVLDEERVRYVAARTLPKNHFLTAADLARDPELPRATDVMLPEKSSLVNHWLDREVTRHQAIERRFLSARPIIDQIADTAIVVATIPEDLTARMIDAGSTVALGGEAGVIVDRATVVARQCVATNCVVLVRVSTADAAKVAAAKTAPAALLRAVSKS